MKTFKTTVATGAHLRMWGYESFLVPEALHFALMPHCSMDSIWNALASQDKYPSQGSSKCILANSEKLFRALAFLFLFILHLLEQQNLIKKLGET